MDGTKLTPDLNLLNLSMISIAARLWDSQDIKKRMKNKFLVRNREYAGERWCEITKLVVQRANSINLPPRLFVLLKKTILRIGQKIHDWIFYVTKILRLDSIYAQKIYFSFGAVDEIKIFDLYWRDLMATDNCIYKSHYFRHSPLFSLACIYGCERFLKERKNEMLNKLSEFYPQIKEGDEIYNIMSVSICMSAKASILENVASPQRMFEVCLEAGFSKAARFYWEKLDEIEKISNLTYFAKKCWPRENQASFLTEKYLENLLFLINQMGAEERYLFFADYADEIIRLCLPIWPYQELIVDLLTYDWDIGSLRLLKMANFLIFFTKTMNLLEFPLDNELVFQLMQKAWPNISIDEKLYFFQRQFRIVRLVSTLNPGILNLLFNDPSTIKYLDGKKMYYFIKKGFVESVKRRKFNVLNSIFEADINFIPKRKKFLNEIFSNHYFIRDLLEADESFGLVDQLLDWSAESEAERARLKEKINTIFVCRFLTERPTRIMTKYD